MRCSWVRIAHRGIIPCSLCVFFSSLSFPFLSSHELELVGERVCFTSGDGMAVWGASKEKLPKVKNVVLGYEKKMIDRLSGSC